MRNQPIADVDREAGGARLKSAAGFTIRELSMLRALAVGGAITAAGTSMVIPLLTTYLTEARSVSAATAGWVLALFFAGKLVGHLLGGIGADRYGRRSVMLASIGGSSAASLVAGLANELGMIVGAVVSYGFLAGAFQPAGTAAVSDVIAERRRMAAFSYLRVAHNVGFAVGPALAAALLMSEGPNPHRTLFIIDAITSGVFFMLIAMKLPETLEHHREGFVQSDESAGVRAVLQDRAFLAFAGAFGMTVFVYVQLFSTMGPFLIESYGVPHYQFAAWLSLNAMVVVAFQLAITKAVRRFRSGSILFVGSVLQAVGLFVLIAGGGLALMVSSIVVFTIGEMLLAPTGEAVATRFAARGLRGRYMGVFLLAVSVGLALGPLIGGMFLSANLGKSFLWCLLIVGTAAGILAKRLVDRRFAEGLPVRDRVVASTGG